MACTDTAAGVTSRRCHSFLTVQEGVWRRDSRPAIIDLQFFTDERSRKRIGKDSSQAFSVSKKVQKIQAMYDRAKCKVSKGSTKG